ncbi:hypothetical protein [Agrobacterium tumefaciens]|uniref:hypothetical protein n=1 Tax=Agrobacterium tumefaciens TaxID=358 RepID=UPI0011787002|nr:hypothetical protein [Agrobacterium tumefaciens]
MSNIELYDQLSAPSSFIEANLHSLTLGGRGNGFTRYDLERWQRSLDPVLTRGVGHIIRRILLDGPIHLVLRDIGLNQAIRLVLRSNSSRFVLDVC